MNNMTIRILFAVIAAPITLFLLYWHQYTRLGLVISLLTIGAWEWSRMVASQVNGPKMRFTTPFFTFILAMGWAVHGKHPYILAFLAAMLLLSYIVIAFIKVDVENIYRWLSLHISAPLYMGLWGGLSLTFLGTGRGFHSSAAFITVMLAMWVCDTFAYFTGRLFGSRKMAPQISPKKTWEGAAGGTLFTMSFIAVIGPWAFKTALLTNLVLGFLLSFAGQAGDLLMSALKRWSGFKDSSRIFPGHGGVLDRMDSLLLSAPLAATIMMVLGG